MTAKARKPTTKGRATRRHAPAITPPPGLAVAFKMLSESDHTNIAARSEAERYYPYARAFIEAVNTTDGDSASAVIKKATKRDHVHCFDDDEIAETPELTGHTAFRVGFAACWLLMTDVNEQGGGR